MELSWVRLRTPIKKIAEDSGNNFDYHEDDFCMVEMLPFENIEEIDSDRLEIDDISQNHSDGRGFTKLHVISEKKVKILDRKILLSEAVEIDEGSGLQRIDRITTGWGSQKYDSEYSIGFGKKSCAIIFVRHIWFDLYPEWMKPECSSVMTKLTLEFANRWDLVFADWRQNIVLDVRIEHDRTAYFEMNKN